MVSIHKILWNNSLSEKCFEGVRQLGLRKDSSKLGVAPEPLGPGLLRTWRHGCPPPLATWTSCVYIVIKEIVRVQLPIVGSWWSLMKLSSRRSRNGKEKGGFELAPKIRVHQVKKVGDTSSWRDVKRTLSKHWKRELGREVMSATVLMVAEKPLLATSIGEGGLLNMPSRLKSVCWASLYFLFESGEREIAEPWTFHWDFSYESTEKNRRNVLSWSIEAFVMHP